MKTSDPIVLLIVVTALPAQNESQQANMAKAPRDIRMRSTAGEHPANIVLHSQAWRTGHLPKNGTDR